MALDQLYPDLEELLRTIDEAGLRVSGIEASGGAAGAHSSGANWSGSAILSPRCCNSTAACARTRSVSR